MRRRTVRVIRRERPARDSSQSTCIEAYCFPGSEASKTSLNAQNPVTHIASGSTILRIFAKLGKNFPQLTNNRTLLSAQCAVPILSTNPKGSSEAMRYAQLCTCVFGTLLFCSCSGSSSDGSANLGGASNVTGGIGGIANTTASGGSSLGNGGTTASHASTASTQSGGTSSQSTTSATTFNCPPAQVDIASAYPDIKSIDVGNGSGFYTPGTGGTIVDGTYYLASRTLHGSGTVPSYESGVLIVKGNSLELLWSSIIAPIASACVGAYTTSNTTFNGTSLASCYGDASAGFCGRSAGYTATASSLTFFAGNMEYGFTKP